MMQDKPYKSVLIVGCGYIGRRVAGLLPADHYHVTGSVRSKQSAAQLELSGIAPMLIDLDQPAARAGWADGFDEVFYFAPPPSHGEQDLRMHAFLRAMEVEAPPRRIVYISTSAVYGDCQGAWITESQALNPTTARGQRRLDAEQRLTACCELHNIEWVLLRVPGIYGPGKLPLARLREGTAVLREADSPYTNRIHADDLARICIAAMNSPHANTVYNVSDGQPSNMTDYFFKVADAAGMRRPPTISRFEAAQVLSAGMLSFLNDSRRMSNAKMLDELAVELLYPDLDSGLRACFTA
jgi:nucleoside-diphosphate-sugar epimerase